VAENGSLILILTLGLASPFDKTVKDLARIRDEEGYIAESKKDSKKNGKHVILEYNCHTYSREALGSMFH
jgi:predicted ArsR family transcriptional regulator